MKNFIKAMPWIVLLIVSILFIRQCNEKKVPEYVPYEVEVLVPSVEKIFDTIYEPKPYPVKVIEIDSTFYEEYKQLKDSVAKDSMFKEAIKINEYNQVFEDTLQTIDVYSKTRGKLLEQNVKYTTKPYTITVKDSIEIKKKTHLNLGGELGVPTNLNNLSPIFKLNGIIRNKKGNTYSLGYDTEGRVWVGTSIKIF